MHRIPHAIGGLVAALALVALPSLASAQRQKILRGPSAKTISGVALLDCSRKAEFKVGDWVKYHIKSETNEGVEESYDYTFLIAGEEEFWGDRCFWLETWTQPMGGDAQMVATLISYSAFGEADPLRNIMSYMRKRITAFDENDQPIINLTPRPPSQLRNRPEEKASMHVDTLGHETVTVPKGTYDCEKVRRLTNVAVSEDVSDSTERTEILDDQYVYFSKKVPITSIVKQTMEYATKKKTFGVGRSQQATPERLINHVDTTVDLIAYGSGEHGKLIPAVFRKPLWSGPGGTGPRIAAVTRKRG